MAIVLTERKLANVAAQDPEPDRPARRWSPSRLALFLLIFGLIRGNPEGWGSAAILASLIGAAALLVAFLAIELRSAHPMLDLTLFRKPAFNGVSAVAFGLSAGMFAMFLYLTIYMQGVLDYSPLQAGLRFLPLTVLSFVVAPIAGTLSNRIPIRVLLGIGLATVGVGLLLMHGITADLGLDRPAAPASSSPASGSASPTRASARRRSRSCRWRKPGWARGSTPPSARSASRPASPGSARSSSPRSTRSSRELLPHAPKGLGELVSSGGSRAAAAAVAARRSVPRSPTRPTSPSSAASTRSS